MEISGSILICTYIKVPKNGVPSRFSEQKICIWVKPLQCVTSDWIIKGDIAFYIPFAV
jgi:hypothetical protein